MRDELCNRSKKGKGEKIWARDRFSSAGNPPSLSLLTPSTTLVRDISSRIRQSRILGDPGVDSGDEEKSKRAEEYMS